MPADMNRYPKDWKAISLRIRERDGWKCKFCGAENGQPNPRTGSIVVLTVAHLHDADPMNVSDDNLAALCQQCHNQLDAPMRAHHRKATNERKRRETLANAGQQEMF